MNSIIGEGYKPNLTTAKVDTIENQAVNEASRVAAEQVAADWDKIRQTEKEKFVKAHETKLKDDDLTIFSLPRVGCKHCYGTGIEGAYTNESHRLPGQPCLCRCLTNRLINYPGQPDPNRLTYKAFKQLMHQARQRFNLKEPENEQCNEVDINTVQGINKEDSTRRNEVKTDGYSGKDIR